MKDKLKAKMDEYLEKILAKDEITLEEFQIISLEYNRLVSKEEMDERMKNLIKSMCSPSE